MTLEVSHGIHKRSSCRLCNSSKLSPEIFLPETVIADHYSASPSHYARKYPLDLYQCQDCGHVQTLDVLPLNLLFSSDYTYKPSRNQKLIDHFVRYAQSVESNLGRTPKKSLDIGSNDGLFLSILRDRYQTEILGIDPADSAVAYAKSAGVNTIHSFFTESEAKKIRATYGPFDHVSANNVYAHNDDLNGLTAGISHLLEDGGIFTFEISYLPCIVDKSLIGTIFHEHLSHHSLLPLIPFLETHNLFLFDAFYVETQGGALVCCASKGHTKPLSRSLEELLEKERVAHSTSPSYMSRFRENLINLRNTFSNLLDSQISSNSRIIGYGAARSANLLIEFFQLTNHLDVVLDDNPEKVDKYISNSDIPIHSASTFEFTSNDIVIPLAWIHSQAITERLLGLKVGLSVVSFYPEPAVLS